MVSLACANFRSPTDDVVIRIHLPTLTRTPLPTLTPTAAAAQDVVALPTPAADNAVLPSATATATPPPLLTPTNTYAAPPSVAGNQNNSRPTLTSRVTLNVRSGPGLGHSVVGKLVAGQSTGITGQNPDGSWWQIEYPAGSGQQAWVSADPQYSTVSQTMPQTIAQAATPTSPPVAAAVTATSPLLASAPPTPTPVLSPTETPLPASTPTETPIPMPAGWVFSGVRPLPARYGQALLVHGILINNTGTTQTLTKIKGVFYDDPGLAIANYRHYYPVSEVPQGGRLPFELMILGHSSAGNFDLEVSAEGGGAPPRQTFEFLEVNGVPDDDELCVEGRVRNTGDELDDYLVVAAVLYDGEDKVINYYDYYEESPDDLVGDQVQEVSICVDSLDQEVARYELQAWGL